MVKFVSDLVRWVDETYESLFAGENVKEYVWWITTRMIRSIFEDYLAPDKATPTHTSFGSDLHLQNTCEQLPMRLSGGDKQTLDVLCRDNHEIFWSRYTVTVKVILGHTKEIIRREREGGSW